MSETDPDQRMRAVTAAIAERERLVRVQGKLAQDVANEEQRVRQLAAELQFERADVERLTTGVMGFLQQILLDENALAKEQREVVEAQARLREAQGSLELLRTQARDVAARLAQLVPAQLDAELAAARAAKEATLMRSGSPLGQQLQDIAIRIESIDIELVPLADAVVAGDTAFKALAEILAVLDGVAGRTVELHDKRAQALAGEAQAKLTIFHRALAEVATASFADPLDLDPSDTRFADPWVKALFGKGSREERLAAARASMVARIERIGAMLPQLRARHDELAARRAQLVAERQRLVD